MWKVGQEGWAWSDARAKRTWSRFSGHQLSFQWQCAFPLGVSNESSARLGRDQSLRCPLVGTLLPQENAHFSISESLIAAIELMKCNMMSQCLEEEEGEEDSDREIQELKQKIRLRRQQIRTKNLLPGYQEMEHGSEWGCECLFLPLKGFWIRHGTSWASFSVFICSCEMLHPSQGFLCCQKDFLYCSDFFFSTRLESWSSSMFFLRHSFQKIGFWYEENWGHWLQIPFPESSISCLCETFKEIKQERETRAGFHFPSITASQASVHFSIEVLPVCFYCDPRKCQIPLSMLFITVFFFFLNVNRLSAHFQQLPVQFTWFSTVLWLWLCWWWGWWIWNPRYDLTVFKGAFINSLNLES